MMSRTITITICLLLFTLSSLFAQESESVYGKPLGYRMSLAGNFGEVRSTHFHTGIDIKTAGVTGLAVMSVADGYISRIYVSPTGYGHALYITHPTLNRMTVYAHLYSFSDEITEYVNAYQHRNKRFPVDLYLTKDKFPVSKGDIIARSGNTGSSGGPHLHFEIRDLTTGYTLNPVQECGYIVADRVPPKISNIRVVELDDNYELPIHTPMKRKFALPESNSRYKLIGGDTLYAANDFYLAFEVVDYKDDSNNIFGTKKASIESEGVVIWSYDIDKIPFSYGRGMHSFTLYPQTTITSGDVIRTYISEVNKLNIYPNKINKGVIKKKDIIKPRRFTLKAADERGNTSELSFVVALHPDGPSPVTPPKGDAVHLDKFYNYSDRYVNFTLPAFALQQSTYIDFTYSERPAFNMSKIVRVGNDEMPFLKDATLSIRLRDGLQGVPSSKLYITRLRGSANRYYVGGEYKDGMVTAKIRETGRYVVLCDTIPPTIEDNWVKQFPIREKIAFKVTDYGSGIASYEGYIDEDWALLEYDPKTENLYFNPSLHPYALYGECTHRCTIIVTDRAGNKTVHKSSFFW